MSHAEQIMLLGEAGCRFVQIREKSGPSREFYDAVVNSLAVAKEFGMTLIVNDRVDIAIAAGSDGVHLGQDDLSPAVVRRLIGDGAIIGYSSHSVVQAIEAATMPVDYIAVGPVFATSTKENPDPVIGLHGIQAIREAIGGIPIVAIGGITSANIAEVLRAGADSAAVISDLFLPGSALGDRYQAIEQIAQSVKQH